MHPRHGARSARFERIALLALVGAVLGLVLADAGSPTGVAVVVLWIVIANEASAIWLRRATERPWLRHATAVFVVNVVALGAVVLVSTPGESSVWIDVAFYAALLAVVITLYDRYTWPCQSEQVFSIDEPGVSAHRES